MKESLEQIKIKLEEMNQLVRELEEKSEGILLPKEAGKKK